MSEVLDSLGGPAVFDPGASDPLSSEHRRGFWSRFVRHPGLVTATLFVLALVVIAFLGRGAAPANPTSQNLLQTFARPTSAHPLGTDSLGRDELSLLLYACRYSMLAVIEVLGFAAVIGIPVGLLAGASRRRLRSAVLRVSDSVLAFPPLLLSIAVVGALGPSLTHAMLAVGIFFTPRFVRGVEAAVAPVLRETYIEASRAMGTPFWRIVLWHLLPNCAPAIAVQVMITAAYGMLAEAGLSFLGIGVQPPQVSWGLMLSDSVNYLNNDPILMVWPGVVITLTVLALNTIADGIRKVVHGER